MVSRPPKAPVRRAKLGDTLDVDGLLIDVAQGMFEQQHDRVDDVFLVDLHDLHFFEQHFGQGDAGGVHFEPARPTDHMAEIKLFIEDVDVQSDLRHDRRSSARLLRQ